VLDKGEVKEVGTSVFLALHTHERKSASVCV